MTGMRIGEAAALQWDDIDFETGLLSITKNTVLQIHDRIQICGTQNAGKQTYYCNPNSNFEVAKKLAGKLTYTPATHSVADYTSNGFTAEFHKQVK